MPSSPTRQSLSSILTSVAVIALCVCSPSTLAAQSMTHTLAGRWLNAEQGIVVTFERDSAGLYQGTVIESARSAEVGARIFRDLRYQADKAEFRGRIARPNGDAAVGATVTIDETGTLVAVGKKLFFTKTLRFQRTEE